MTTVMDLRVEELSPMDAPSDWSDFVNGTLAGISIVVIAAAVT